MLACNKSFHVGARGSRDGMCVQHLLDVMSGVIVVIATDLLDAIKPVVNYGYRVNVCKFQ